MAFLVDGEAYFSALASTLKQARRFIFLCGWQLDSRLRLDPRNAASPRFGDFLHDLVRRNRKLRIYVLVWDFAMIYAADREIVPLYTHPWRTHRRIHFRLDSNHPLGASHHQKIVVVDDRVAFVGGLDIAEHRWDTPKHEPQDPYRLDSLGRLYPPYHDVQLMVDGAAALAVGHVVKERWRRATGKRVRIAAGYSENPWPADVAPDLENVSVAISRTEPADEVRQEVREVESLYLDSIRQARALIYLENQYLSSSAIGDALAARLEEKDGPEVIMVLPEETSEWLEQVSMAVLRWRLLKRLRAADRFGRLHVYFPVLENESVQVRIHSKVCFIDDRLLRVGSANLNNRSMGLDTECDLAVETERPAIRHSIATLRNRLLAEHLGVSPERVALEHATTRSLARAIENLRGGTRSLGILDGSVSPILDEMVPAAAVIDPERPLSPDKFMQDFMPMGTRRRAVPGLLRLATILLSLAVLVVLMRTTSLQTLVDYNALSDWLGSITSSPLAAVWVAGAFTMGSLALAPITLLIIATIASFGPALGFWYALGGCLASALVLYSLGRMAGKETVRRIAGSRLGRVQRQMSRHGFISMLFARIIPIAPFAVVNLVAGAMQIRAVDFLLATVMGMSPGIAAVVLLDTQLRRFLVDPTIGNVALLVTLAICFALAGAGFYHWYGRKAVAGS
ncbi:MAG TPA: VTT domain-containing protein [Candidatus Binatia bacterium]